MEYLGTCIIERILYNSNQNGDLKSEFHGDYGEAENGDKGLILDYDAEYDSYLISVPNSNPHTHSPDNNLHLWYHEDHLSNIKLNRNEVFRKNQQQRGSEKEGSKVCRAKIEITSGSRFVGSRATNLRRRESSRQTKIRGERLFFI